MRFYKKENNMKKQPGKKKIENEIFNTTGLTKKFVEELNFELKLKFANEFFEKFLNSAKQALKAWKLEENLQTLKHIGHKLGGHAEFPSLTKLGDLLENKVLSTIEGIEVGKVEITAIINEIDKVYQSEIIPFLNEIQN